MFGGFGAGGHLQRLRQAKKSRELKPTIELTKDEFIALFRKHIKDDVDEAEKQAQMMLTMGSQVLINNRFVKIKD